MKELQKELILPNGSKIKNRIGKSAMSENLSDKWHRPSSSLINVYKSWAKGGAGLIITGNVMIDPKAIGEPRNVVVEDRTDLKLLKEWANSAEGTNAHLWVQLNHPGRQAMELINNELLAPSAVPVKLAGRKNASKTIPRALSNDEILNIIDRFGETAAIIKEAGFNGVQIHGAHGYLVSQFLSPHTNIRKDQWGGSLENRSRFLIQVYRQIRKRVGDKFPVGIKLNSADFQRGGFSEEESMEVIKMLSQEGIDLIEISGGTYESPAMMGSERKSTQSREAYFISYIEKARKITDIPLMLTGGFRTATVMQEALSSNKLDIVGIARPFAVYPELANELLSGKRRDIHTKIKKSGFAALDGLMNLIWYEFQIKRIGQNKKPNPNLSPWKVLMNYVKLIMVKRFSSK